MNTDLVTLVSILAVLSVVQSVFGIGLLLLGTPTLLLVGLSFQEILWILLPASLAVSTMQLAFDGRIGLCSLRSFAVWAVPPLILGLLIALGAQTKLKVDLAVGALLLVGATIRLSTTVRSYLMRQFERHEWGALAGIGLVHGLTNMGGGLLSLYASIRHDGKYQIRQLIALGYATFALSQLAVLGVTTHSPPPMADTILYAALAGFTFVLVGRSAFNRVSSTRYNVLFSVFEIGCGVVLITRRLIAA